MILDTKLTCPKCGCESPFKAFQTPEEIMEISRLAAKLGSRWPWVAEYLHSFQVDHDKPLRPAKLKLLILEVQEMIDKHGFTFEKKQHAIRPEAIYLALRNVALKNMVGMKTHNYLKKVAIDLNQKMVQKEEKDQRERAQEAMSRGRDPHGPERVKELIKTMDDGR